MKCSKAHKWIALYREGELEPGLQEKLREHLAQCESCSRLYQTYIKNERIAALIRSANPEPDNKELLTGRIMNALADIKDTSGQPSLMAIFARLLEIFMLPLTRRVALACVLIIAVAFGFQQTYIYSKVTKLENQLAAAGETYRAKSGKADVEDCMRSSARFLLRFIADQRETEKNLHRYFREHPDKLNLYVSLLCNQQYRSLKKYVNQDNYMVQDILFKYESITE